MATNANPLLKKVYHENCPGCKQDRRNEAHPGIPYKEFFYIWAVTLCSALPISSLFPFLYFMIRDLHISKREEDIGFYAGFVGSAFMFGRALTSVFWGMVADRYGRKPVIVISIVSVIVFNTLFGLSTSYVMAITTRSLLGFLCGLLGPIKAYASEVCRREHQALGLSLVTTSRGIGLIVGPAIGGFLAQETLHMHKENSLGDGTVESLEASLIGSDLKRNDEETEGRELASSKSLIKNWPLISSIIVYCVFSLQDMAYSEIFSLWAVSNKSYGGLSFSSQDVGEVLAISGFSLLVYQLLLYPHFAKCLGPITSSRVAAVLSIPLLASYPFMAKLSGFTLSLIVNCASLLKNAFSVTIITGFNILQNNAVSQHQRGAANGISITAMSLFKAAAPAGGGALFSWAQRRQNASFLPGDRMVFFVLNIIGFVGLLLTFKPFLNQPSRKSTT
ncbi:probable peptide/nitrate transporter At3g43790 isoform X7 [Elaeis guineensis]|uniref:Probable peptide/nitrate transporter At3g43790 isoform X2 n=1 Tax=Elaeis guineensis var. tenera TaxID=51953 RepID=A0A6I9QHY4_ELAGV|nr:probable peptide/nitrate transporter At3g43790 isoform X2 [Elaeis guineensis]